VGNLEKRFAFKDLPKAKPIGQHVPSRGWIRPPHPPPVGRRAGCSSAIDKRTTDGKQAFRIVLHSGGPSYPHRNTAAGTVPDHSSFPGDPAGCNACPAVITCPVSSRPVREPLDSACVGTACLRAGAAGQHASQARTHSVTRLTGLFNRAPHERCILRREPIDPTPLRSGGRFNR